MPPPPRRLRVPAKLAFTIAFAQGISGCPQSPSADAGDVASDRTNAETGADVASDLADIVFADTPGDTPGDSGLSDVVDDCQPVPFQAGYYECLSDPRADVQTTCNGNVVCSPSQCASGCVACPTNQNGETGFACLDTSADGGNTACGSAPRVCNAGDCPAGCQACADVFFCMPDTSSDAAPPSCNPMYVCGGSDCPTGCRALG